MTCEWQRDGDEFMFTWADAGIAIGFSQLLENRGELHSEIWVRSSLPTQQGHIHWGRLNLSSTSTREKLASTLSKRVPELDSKEWTKMLEMACTTTALEFRKGEPTVRLATLPRPSGSPYLVHRLLPLNVSTILFGDGGTAKSMIALWLAAAIQTKHSLPCGLFVNKQVNTMYLDWESWQEDHVERLYALTEAWKLKELPDIQYRRMRRPLSEEVTKLRAEISRLKIGFLIVDSLGFAAGGKLTESEVALNVMDAIGKIGVTTLGIAHITKEAAKEENGRTTPFGSAFFSFAARSTWEIRKSGECDTGELTVGLYHRKANRGAIQRNPIGLRIEYEENSADERLERVYFSPFTVADDPELAAHAPLSYRLKEALRKANGIPMSAEALSREIGSDVKERTVSRTLRRMKDVVNLAEARGRGSIGQYVLKAVV